MRFIAKRVAVSAVSCLSLLFILLHLSAMQAVAAPAETSHWNSNTFGNLNALTDKTTITFSVGYNEEGTIEWYKDGILRARDRRAPVGGGNFGRRIHVPAHDRHGVNSTGRTIRYVYPAGLIVY